MKLVSIAVGKDVWSVPRGFGAILFSESTLWVKVAAARLHISVSDYVEALRRGEKFCGGCRLPRPRTSEFFGKASRCFDGMQSRCRICVAGKKKEHYSRSRDATRPKRLAYSRANRSKLYAYNARWQRERNAALRAEMLAAYGANCACCGESERIFLDLDHINNDGARHRREMGNQAQVLLALRAAGWPRDAFQVLCCNCNQGKARNGGICPHVKNRS